MTFIICYVINYILQGCNSNSAQPTKNTSAQLSEFNWFALRLSVMQDKGRHTKYIGCRNKLVKIDPSFLIAKK